MNQVNECVAHLEAGGILAYPTETIWGLGVDSTNVTALDSLFTLKGRERLKAVSVLVKDVRQAEELVFMDERHRRILEIFWPGPVTAVMPARDRNYAEHLGSGEFVGLRCSSHRTLDFLVTSLDSPLVTTSANESGKGDPKTREDLFWLPDSVKILDEGEELPGGSPSTVIKFFADKVQLLREGAIPWEVAQRTCLTFGIHS